MTEQISNKVEAALRKILIFVFLIWSAPSFAQQYNIDSLLLEFKHAPGVDLRTYDQLFIALYPEYMEELVLVAEDLLTRSVQTQNMNGMHRAADAFGIYFVQKGYFNQAFKILYRSMRFYERTENQAYLMKAYHYLGTLFLSWGNTDEAIYYYKLALKLATISPNPVALFTSRTNLALAYFQKQRYDAGIELLKENMESSHLMNEESIATTLNLLGNYYLDKYILDSAKFYYKECIQYSQKISKDRITSTAYANLAICEFGDAPDESLHLFEESYRYAIKSQSKERISVSLFNIASWHLEFEDYPNALRFYSESYEVAKQSNLYISMFDALDEIADVYRSQNNWVKVDSINLIIRDIRTQQYHEFIDLSNNSEILEAAFANNKPFKDQSQMSQSSMALLNWMVVVGLVIFVFVQFVVILYMSLRLARKH